MITAVFSDVHGNLEALEAVLRDAREQGAGRFVCLGDVVGYGADPDACCERVRDLKGVVVRGNHDHACSHRSPLVWFNPLAAAAARWTRAALSEGNRAWLRDLPYEAREEGAQFVHGGLEDPRHWPYLFPEEDASAHFRRQRERFCFVGHTHVPVLFAQVEGRVRAARLSSFRLGPDEPVKVTVNVGSVGQPRNGDPRACYCLWDTERGVIAPRRIAYDVDAAERKIRAAGLPELLAERLSLGR